MQAAQEFMVFLVDQTESKLGEIKKQTAGESTKFVVDEVSVYVKKLRDVIALTFDAEPQTQPDPPTPASGTSRGRNRGASNG